MDDEIQIYNTDKKIAQLNKILFRLISGLTEKIYQKQILQQKYEQQIQSFLDKSKKEVDAIHLKLKPETEEIEKNIQTKMNSKFKLLEMKFKTQLADDKKSLNTFTSQINTELKGIISEINDINSKYEIQKVRFSENKEIPDLNSLRGTIQHLENVHRSEIAKIDDETYSKQQRYEEDFKKKLKTLQLTHQKNLAEARKALVRPITPVVSSHNVSNLKEKINPLKLVLNSKNELIRFMNEEKVLISGFKTKLRTLLEEMHQLALKILTENKAQNALIDESKVKWAKEIDELNEKKKALLEKNESESTALSEKLKKLLSDNFDALFKKEKEKEAINSNNDINVATLIENLKKFQETAAQRMNQEKNNYELKLHDLQEKIDFFLKNNNSIELENLQKCLNEMKNSETDDIESIKIQYQNEINQSNEDHEKDILYIKSQLDDSNSLAKQYAAAEREKKKLLTIQNAQIKTFESSLIELQNSFSEETQKTEKDFNKAKNHLEKHQNENEKEYVETSTNRINELELQNQNDLEQFEQSKEKELENSIKEIKEQYNNKYCEEKDELETKYKAEYDELQLLLNNLTEKEQDNNLNISEINIDELMQQLFLLKSTISEERSNLLNDWEQRIEEMEKQSQDLLLSSLTGLNNIDDEQEKIDFIESMRKKAKEKMNELTEVMNKLTEELNQLQERSILSSVDGGVIDEKQLELQEKLKQLVIDCRQKVIAAKNNSNEEIQNAFHVFKDTESSYKEKFFEEKEKEDQLIKEYHKLFQKETEKRKNARQKHISLYKEKTLQYLQEIDSQKSKSQQLIEEYYNSINVFIDKNRETQEKESIEISDQTLKIQQDLQQQEKNLYEMLQKSRLGDLTLDQKLMNAAELRDRAKKAYFDKPMRPEERIITEKLEQALGIKTKQLVTIGKELMKFRGYLIHQEGEYNGRFGVDPSVAEAKPKKITPKRSLTAASIKRLPRLI